MDSGNIRVFARVRPAIREDGSGPQAKVVVSIDPDDDGIINVMYKTRQQTFEVDRAFDPSVSQEEVHAFFINCYPPEEMLPDIN